MLKNLANYYFPRSLDDAGSILSEKQTKNVIIAGGTAVSLLRDQTIDGLVDLKYLPLVFIKETVAGYSIGAMTTAQEVFQSSALSGPVGDLIRKAAGNIGSTLIRNSVTVGGNLVSVFPWSDLPPAFLALDAAVVSRHEKRNRTIPLMKLYSTHPRNILKHGEIVTEIKIPKASPNSATAFTKFSKTKNDYAIVDVAVRICLKNKKVFEAAIALSAISKLPMRARQLIA
ncbi:FAD binding domain-containing protein [bacterium]|nr:FAD binding domain-containing protein [bacterium]